MSEVIYNNDRRYPAPEAYPLPDMISGTPTQAELDAQPRLFTWGELKEIIKSGELQYLSRNKEIQARYGEWIKHQQEIWGSSENYLVNARLPWNNASRRPCEPTYDQRTALDHPEINLTPSTNPDTKKKTLPRSPDLKPVPGAFPGAGLAAVAAHQLHPHGSGSPASSNVSQMQASHVATAASTPAGSGASTPNSVAYVSLESVLPRVNKALARKRSKRRSAVETDTPSSRESSADQQEDDDDDDDPAHDVFLRWEGHLDPEKYAVLPNDWPYCVPYGVRHYCVWSRVPIAHPVLVNYDRRAWAKIEERGLGGFTGVVPVLRDGDVSDVDDDSNDERNELPPERPFTPSGSPKSPLSPVAHHFPKSPTSPTSPYSRMPMTPPPKLPPAGRRGPDEAGKGGWYAVDVEYGGREMRRWAGVTYESKGGKEIGRMVRGLWDERGWETVWFVNPARLQSVPGFSHFHVFARRKTPPEIDISEKVHAARERHRMAKAERSKRHENEIAQPVPVSKMEALDLDGEADPDATPGVNSTHPNGVLDGVLESSSQTQPGQTQPEAQTQAQAVLA